MKTHNRIFIRKIINTDKIEKKIDGKVIFVSPSNIPFDVLPKYHHFTVIKLNGNKILLTFDNFSCQKNSIS